MEPVWNLRIQRSQEDGVTILTLAGRLGADSSGEFIEALVALIRDGATRLLLGLARVDYISSAGLVALDAVMGRLHESGGELVICGVCEPVRLALEMAGLLDHPALAPSRAAGIAQLRR